MPKISWVGGVRSRSRITIGMIRTTMEPVMCAHALGIMTFEHDGRGVADNGEHFAWSLTGRRITVDYGFIPARLTVSEICERRMVWKVLATEAGSVKYYGRIVFERL